MTRSCTTCSHPRAVSDPSAGAVREFELALACAAISPGLRTVLVLNADERTLQFAADILARYVRDLTGRTTVTVAVPSASDEDGLWHRSLPAASEKGFVLEERSGAFGKRGDGARGPVLLIPDVARLELPAARGLLAALDPVIVHLERHGISRTWRPDVFCMAACERDQAVTLSPHLLDRFALRLDGTAVAGALDGPNALARWLDGQHAEPVTRATTWQPPGARRPAVADPALDRVLIYLPQAGTRRRALALARLATAIAALERDSEVLEAHVDRAAAIIGLRGARDDGPAIRNRPTEPDASAGETHRSPPARLTRPRPRRPMRPPHHPPMHPTATNGNAQAEGSPVEVTQLVEAAQAAAVTSSSFTPAPAVSPYPEDSGNPVRSPVATQGRSSQLAGPHGAARADRRGSAGSRGP